MFSHTHNVTTSVADIPIDATGSGDLAPRLAVLIGQWECEEADSRAHGILALSERLEDVAGHNPLGRILLRGKYLESTSSSFPLFLGFGAWLTDATFRLSDSNPADLYALIPKTRSGFRFQAYLV